MTIDFEACLGAVTRSVAAVERDGKPLRAVTLERHYDTDVEDLWDAVTHPERLARWFAPVAGDFEQGGRFQITGNAEGTIETCAPPEFLALTWEFGGGKSWVELRLRADGGERAHLSLTHIAPIDDHWKKFGAGATGVGWDLALVGLQYEVSGAEFVRPTDEEMLASENYKTAVRTASMDWGRAQAAAGDDADEAQASAKATAAFYTGETV